MLGGGHGQSDGRSRFPRERACALLRKAVKGTHEALSMDGSDLRRARDDFADFLAGLERVKGFGGGENIFLSCEGVRGACHLSVRGLTRQNLRPGRELRRCDTQLRYVE